MHTTKLLVVIVALSSVGLASAAERPTKKLRTKRNTQKNKDSSNIMDEEDVDFWTRLLQDDRGKDTEIGSMPEVPRPPAGGVPRTTMPTMNLTMKPTAALTAALTPDPTPDPTRRPTPTPPTPTPPTPTPPTPTPPTPTPPTPTPPTPTPPTPTAPTFNCAPAAFVGCTATDPADPQDECETVGEPCTTGIVGEFCCRDECPRNYCTAKEAIRG